MKQINIIGMGMSAKTFLILTNLVIMLFYQMK